MLFRKQECNRNNPNGWSIRAIMVRSVGSRMRIQCYCQKGPLWERLGKHQCGHMWPCAATRDLNGKQGNWLMTNNMLQTSDVCPKNLLHVGSCSEVRGASNIRFALNPHWTPHDILSIIQRNTIYDPSKTLLITQFQNKHLQIHFFKNTIFITITVWVTLTHAILNYIAKQFSKHNGIVRITSHTQNRKSTAYKYLSKYSKSAHQYQVWFTVYT